MPSVAGSLALEERAVSWLVATTDVANRCSVTKYFTLKARSLLLAKL